MVMVLLVSVILFRFARFGRFGCFGGFVSVVSAVSLVSLVSFRWFRFVVLGFSTCRIFLVNPVCSLQSAVCSLRFYPTVLLRVKSQKGKTQNFAFWKQLDFRVPTRNANSEVSLSRQEKICSWSRH